MSEEKINEPKELEAKETPKKQPTKTIILGAIAAVCAILAVVFLVLWLRAKNNTLTDQNDDSSSVGNSDNRTDDETGEKKDEISVNADGYVVVNGVTTEILADKTDVITVDLDGYVVVNGVKTEYKVHIETVNENPLGLLFVLKDDNTYSVEIGQAKYQEKIEIPSTYNGKPVTEISNFSYYVNEDMSLSGYEKSNHYLKEIIIPEGITTISDDAFGGCVYLNNVILPDSLIYIGNRAFAYCCVNLFSVTLGKNLEIIGEDAFLECIKLKEIINNSSLNVVNESYIPNDYDIMFPDHVDIHTGESKLSVIGDYTFYSKNNKNYLVKYTGNDSEIILPEDYKGEKYEIERFVFINDFFAGNTSLKKVTISDGVTTIGSSAFYGCSSLTSIVIPDSVTSIDSDAFIGCHSLTDVYYTGSEEEWEKISDDFYFVSAKIHYNYTPEE